MFMMCFLNDVFLCSLMGYLQCWVAFIGTHGFQIGSHNEIQFVFYLVITSLKTKPMVLSWVKSNFFYNTLKIGLVL
jgi:hypothetical protein